MIFKKGLTLVLGLGFLAISFASAIVRAKATETTGTLPIALIYDGPGSCEEGCTKAAAQVARMAGYQVRFIKPDDINDHTTHDEMNVFFKGTKVWIQPGGISNEAFYTMSDKLREALVHFVGGGGGYVGFCAGAFMATAEIGGTGEAGLGIFPGGTDLFEAYNLDGTTFSLQDVSWGGVQRKIYFEGGPFMTKIEENPNVEVVARYSDGTVAAGRTRFGLGRVFVTGLHPEAPKSWTEEDGIKDPDGTEQELAASMVCWAGKKAPCPIQLLVNEPPVPKPGHMTKEDLKKWLRRKLGMSN